MCCFRQWWCGDDDMIVPSPSWSRLRATILDPIVKTGNLSIVYYRCCIPLCMIVWAVRACLCLCVPFSLFLFRSCFLSQCLSCAHFCLFFLFPIFSHACKDSYWYANVRLSVRVCVFHKSISRKHTHTLAQLFIDTKRVKIWENVRATQWAKWHSRAFSV